MVYVPNPPSELSLIEDYSTMEKYIGGCIRKFDIFRKYLSDHNICKSLIIVFILFERYQL